MYIQKCTILGQGVIGSVKRKGKLINIWLSEEQKAQLDRLAEKTHVNKSELVRQALELLLDKAEGGQLSLGFPIRQSED